MTLDARAFTTVTVSLYINLICYVCIRSVCRQKDMVILQSLRQQGCGDVNDREIGDWQKICAREWNNFRKLKLKCYSFLSFRY